MSASAGGGPTGRFAPSPSGSLHLGNLRTALVAYCAAKVAGGRFLLRIEDLTTGAAPVAEAEQLADLALLGIVFDGEPVRQSQRSGRYEALLAELTDRGLTYECYCSRREIAEAVAAPHGPVNAYPGTCRNLSEEQRRQRRASGRRPALRLKASGRRVGFVDRLAGRYETTVDDFVLRRGDGLVAYNFAVVVDDADAGVDQVVRGDDLVDSTPRQILLQELLGFPRPEYVHVPLVLGPDGERLSKRHGSVGLADQLAAGAEPGQVRALLAHSLGIRGDAASLELEEIVDAFVLERIPRTPWILDPGSVVW